VKDAAAESSASRRSASGRPRIATRLTKLVARRRCKSARPRSCSNAAKANSLAAAGEHAAAAAAYTLAAVDAPATECSLGCQKTAQAGKKCKRVATLVMSTSTLVQGRHDPWSGAPSDLGMEGSLRDICANLERPKIRAKRTQIRQYRGHLEHFSEDHQVGEKCSTILAVFVF